MTHSNADQLAAARRAKDLIKQKYQQSEWFRGVGIAPHPSGFCVRLNVAASAQQSGEALPSQCEGVPVETIVLEGYTLRDQQP